MKKLSLAAMIGLFLFSVPLRSDVDLLHIFTPSNVHGIQPYGELISDGTYLYGMASKMGQYNGGTIFRINSDGSGFLLLHAFAGGSADGRSPLGSLVLSGTTLFGMTNNGGDTDFGTIFKIEKDGADFSLLHEFANNVDDGGYPKGSLIISDTTLYGMTSSGGNNNMGTVFMIGVNGTGFTLLHEFAGGADDGRNPTYGSLIMSGSTLYGTTTMGGDANFGTVFKMETTGSDFALLHEFAGGNDDGAAPIGFLVLSGSTLYGMTRDGGAVVPPGAGTIFKLETSGAGYTLLHKFSDSAADGNSPQGSSMVLSGSTLYGMTYWGGDTNMGTVFKIETSGSGFALLQEFSGSDGNGPFGSLLLIGSSLYGMTLNGGDSNSGTIFKLETSGTGFSSLFSFSLVSGCDGGYPRGTPVLSGTTLYGSTPQGGVNNAGTIYKVETNGSGYALLHEFSYNEGIYPYGPLIISGSTLFGMTNQGGSANRGTIFKIETNGAGFSVLHEFAGGLPDGSNPYGSLILSDTSLYGMTYKGGSSDLGTIFKIETNGTGFSVLHSFIGGAADGKYPYGALVLSGSTLYGMTALGGSSDLGTLFKIETTGSGFSILHSFSGGTLDGTLPRGDLLLSGSTFYGMTSAGGNNNMGTVFKIGTTGNDFALLHSFGGGGDDGRLPYGSLVLSGSGLYGMTYRGGDNTLGTVFMMKNDGTGFSLLHEFAGGSGDGAYPYGSLLIANGTLFGATFGGGSALAGVLFSLPIPGITVTSPNGGESWTVGESHDITWTSTGAIDNVNIDYSTDSGGNWTSVAAGTINDGSYTWTVANAPSTTCMVRIRNAAATEPSDNSDAVFTIVAAETVSTPTAPSGPGSGSPAASYDFSTGGSTSSLGHTVQYKFDWDDGTDSGWLAEGTTSASHSWAANNTYHVRAMARCVTHTAIESLWSDTHGILISNSGPSEYFNSPANRLFLPEVNWAAATGGGTWVSEVQIVDVTGESVVQAYYTVGTAIYGPFTVWTNSNGPYSSISFANILSTIDALDGSATVYYGTNGTLEMVTQDSGHVIQAAARSYNGNYSRTFPALADVETNTAAGSRALMVPNLSNDTNFRPSLVLSNPSADSVSAEVRIIGADGVQIGSTITKVLAGYERGGVVGLRNSTYSNADILVTVTAGGGRVIASGQSAHNVSNDPAAHIAVQAGGGYVNSPAMKLIFPEVNWAAATGGGTWISEVHVSDMTGGTTVYAYYNSGTTRRGPFFLGAFAGGAGSHMTFANILQTLQLLDSGFTYYGTGGTIELVSQDSVHRIQAGMRSYNGNATRTFPALQDVADNTAAVGRDLMIPNISNDIQYRPSLALFNADAGSATVEVRIIGTDGAQIGSTISQTLAGYERVGVAGLRNATYSNAFIRVTVTSGSGRVIASGQSANNVSNDPAAHLAVPAQ